MTDTLFDAVMETAKAVYMWREGIATGGSTTTVVDTVRRKEGDDHWNEGTVFIFEDAGGAGAAPQGEWGIVSDFVNSTATITCSALTAAVAAGDKYGLVEAGLPLDMLISAVNNALSDIEINVEDTTSLDTADDQTEYSLPVAVTERNLRQVWIQTEDDANDNRWMLIRNWRVVPGATGAADTLIFDFQYSSGYDIKLVYTLPHPAVNDASDTISESITMERLKWDAAVHALEYMVQYNVITPDVYERRLPRVEARQALARVKYPVPMARKLPRLTMC